MIQTMIISFMIVGLMFFLTTNEESKSHHQLDNPMVAKKKQGNEIVIQKSHKIVMDKEMTVVETRVEVMVKPKPKPKPQAKAKVPSSVVSTAKSTVNNVIEDKNVQKVKLSTTKEKTNKKHIEELNSDTTIPNIPAIPKTKAYDIELPLPATSPEPVKVKTLKEYESNSRALELFYKEQTLKDEAETKNKILTQELTEEKNQEQLLKEKLQNIQKKPKD